MSSIPWNQKFQVTEFHRPDHVMEYTQYGRVHYLRWLELETHRWHETNLREAWIETDAEGLVAMFTHKKYQAEVTAEENE